MSLDDRTFLLTTTQYWPTIESIHQANRSGHWVLEACENFQKKSSRNRTILPFPQGNQYLSIPLEGGKNQNCPIKDIRISYSEDWRKQHISSIKMHCFRHPYYDHVFECIAPVLDKKPSFLWDLNLELLSRVIWIFGMKELALYETTTYEKSYEDNILDLRNSGISQVPSDLFSDSTIAQLCKMGPTLFLDN